jgi:ribosomal protein S18 acetylase RimI-like enzyme
MTEVRRLTRLDLTDLERIASGYSSDSKYDVVNTDAENRVLFDLRLVTVEKPYIKKYNHFDAETIEQYNKVIEKGFSFGAYDGDLLIGLLIAEARLWNRSLWVYEFHTAKTYRGKGIGKRLMEHAVVKAKKAEFRIIVCETQNTNVAAIKIYRKLGFKMEGIDIFYYRNTDYPDGEIAVFMKRRL